MRLGIALVCVGSAALLGCRAQPPPSEPPPPIEYSGALQSIDPKDLPKDLANDLPNSKRGDGCAPEIDRDLEAERNQIARALILDPNDPEKLADAADLYLTRLPASTEHSEIGLLYAQRGRQQLEQRIKPPAISPKKKAKLKPPEPTKAQRELMARLSLLEGEAQLDLGHAQEALDRLDTALRTTTIAKIELQAHYERAVALFELCRLEDAQRGFENWLQHHAKDETETTAWAHHHLGLTLELRGDAAGAERELATARRLRPTHFFDPLPINAEEFRRIVDVEAKLLPLESIADLKLVHLETAEIPDLADLTLETPPLSPTLLGLFRGLPLGEEPSEPRTIVLYRRNLLRIVRSREELSAEVRTTLLHELGHLRGADEEDLRERGLE